MIDKQALRTQALNETNSLGDKQRFGLFSQPISTAIGDDGPYKQKRHPRNEQGKPVTQERNFQTSPPRSGQLKSSYFLPLNSLAAHTIKDGYIDQGRRLIQEENQAFQKGKRPEVYVPAKWEKTLATPSYPYKQQNPPQLNPKRNREQDGRVKIKPRNAYTNPGSKVIYQYFKPIKYIDDPYERKKNQQIQIQKKNKSLEGQAAFKPNCFVSKQLSKPRAVYGEDVELKPKQLKKIKYNIYKHQTDWRSNNPNKHGIYGTFQQYPKYMQNPPRQVKRKPSAPNEKQAFRSMNSSLTAPSPSITQNPINLRKSFNHSFSRRF